MSLFEHLKHRYSQQLDFHAGRSVLASLASVTVPDLPTALEQASGFCSAPRSPPEPPTSETKSAQPHTDAAAAAEAGTDEGKAVSDTNLRSRCPGLGRGQQDDNNAGHLDHVRLRISLQKMPVMSCIMFCCSLSCSVFAFHEMCSTQGAWQACNTCSDSQTLLLSFIFLAAFLVCLC